jgi:serine O-acetyltransferase
MVLKNLRDEIDTVMKLDPAARSRLEVVLCYPGFHALVLYRIAHWLWERRWLVLGRFISEVGDDVTLYQGVTLGGTKLHRGKRHPTIEDGVIVSAGAKVLGGFTVGKGARIGPNAVVRAEVPPGGRVVAPRSTVISRENRDVRQPPQPQEFAPYATPAEEIPDPVARALNNLVDEVQALRARVAELEAEQGEPVLKKASGAGS